MYIKERKEEEIMSAYPPLSNESMQPDLVEDRQFDSTANHFSQMPRPKITHADTLYFPFLLGVAHRSPAFSPFLWPANRAVQQVKVDVIQTAGLQGFINRSQSRVV